MSDHHFHLTAGPSTILLFYSFTILLCHFCWVQSRRFLHLEPQNLNVGPPFHRSAGPFTILLFHVRWVQQEVFASRAAKPECRTTFVCISDSFFCMSAHVFACRPNVSLFAKYTYIYVYICTCVETCPYMYLRQGFFNRAQVQRALLQPEIQSTSCGSQTRGRVYSPNMEFYC